MILSTLRELYVSSNGDKWEITEDDDKRLFIRHTPSEASGGRQRILTIGSFLEPGLGGLEQEHSRSLSRTVTCSSILQGPSSISRDPPRKFSGFHEQRAEGVRVGPNTTGN